MDRQALIDRVVNDPSDPAINDLTKEEILIVLGRMNEQRLQTAEQLQLKMDVLASLKLGRNKSPATPVCTELVRITSQEEAMLGAFRACDRYTQTLLLLMADNQAKT